MYLCGHFASKGVIPFLEEQKFTTIYTLFDNDEAGRVANEKLVELFTHPDIRIQDFYKPSKDVNKFL